MRGPISMTPDRWIVSPYSWQAAQGLADSLGLPLVVAMVLAGRGLIDPDEARAFLECTAPLPDPFLFAGMEGAVRLISENIDRGGRVVVHGDYDADGITGTALLVLGLRHLGLEAEWYLPNRFQEGYGLSRRAVEAIAAKGPGLLIAVDCGVNYPDEVALARRSGLDVVVVDHHQPGPVLPECDLIHPVAGSYPHNDLCGVGLALKLLHGLHVARRGGRSDVLPEPLYGLLDLVAIGTIADLASLRGENRYYVREGLKLIEIGQRAGLRALALVSGCVGAVDSGSVAYRLAPRLNAAGRLADPSPPLRLLLTDADAEAAALAAELHELNGARQDVERQIFEQAVRQMEGLGELPPVIVLAAPEWHEGVVGIVASRMVERYNRPAVLLGIRDGVAKGSGRSISGYDLLSGLVESERFLTVYGGHTQAVGLTLEGRSVDGFREALEAHAARSIDPQDLLPAYEADAVLRGEEIDSGTALALASLGPFGSGYPRPRLLLVDASMHDVEATRNGAHLRCMLEVDGVRARAIAFGMGDGVETVRARPAGHIIGAQLRVDEWRGVPRPEFLVERIGAGGDGQEGDEGAADRDLPCGTQLASPVLPATSATASLSGGAEADRRVGVDELPPCHDLRDRPSRYSALAQVLATRERVAVLTCSVPYTLPALRRHVPVATLSGEEIRYTGRGYPLPVDESAATWRSWPAVLIEWDVAAAEPGMLHGRSHVVAFDPPYRSAHVALLRAAYDGGAVVHLLYGASEREASGRFLKQLVHPRFGMVCMYKALREGRQGAALLERAAALGWEEARIVLTHADLERAAGILTELGVERHSPGEAKLDARRIVAFAEAEAEYEECLRLCLNL